MPLKNIYHWLRARVHIQRDPFMTVKLWSKYTLGPGRSWDQARSYNSHYQHFEARPVLVKSWGLHVKCSSSNYQLWDWSKSLAELWVRWKQHYWLRPLKNKYPLLRAWVHMQRAPLCPTNSKESTPLDRSWLHWKEFSFSLLNPETEARTPG